MGDDSGNWNPGIMMGRVHKTRILGQSLIRNWEIAKSQSQAIEEKDAYLG